MKRMSFDFEVKKKGKNVTIEGYANANTVDRMKERIDPKGWILDNYKKNPVVLFDHGHDPAFGFMPIGKTLAVAPDEKGLHVKIQLSNSQTEKITAVRDLVEEGILKTFSVGFDPREDTKDGDTIVITKAELIENSIVPIPMNQDSTFALTKRLGTGVSPLAKRWFDSFKKKATLIKEKKYLAALLVQRISDLQEKGDFDLPKVVDHVWKKGGVPRTDVTKIINGEIVKVSPKALKAFADALKIDSKLLASVGQGGVSVLVKAREEVPMEDDPKKEEEKSAEKADAPAMVIHQIHVPKAMFEEAEGAAGMVEENGYKADKMSETETAWVFDQVDAAEVDGGAGAMVDLGQGIMAHVAPPKGAAAAEAEPAKEDEEPAAAEEEEEKAAAEVEEEDPKKDEKAALPSGDAALPQDQNPYLELARTTNTMLGALIEEIKAMSAKLDGMTEAPPKKEEDEDETMKGILSQIRVAHSTTGERLKRLGL